MPINLAVAYIAFSIIATLSNLATQDFIIRLLTGNAAIPLSIFFGTASGLLIKYILDKKYIFKYKTSNIKHNTKTFLAYTLMGGITTGIFWGFEFGFHYHFQSKEMRYIGGVFGLSIGYILKYYLDKKFVFAMGK